LVFQVRRSGDFSFPDHLSAWNNSHILSKGFDMTTLMLLCAILPAMIIFLGSGFKIVRKPVSVDLGRNTSVLRAEAAPAELVASADHPVATRRVVTYTMPRLLW
jgi:hypothetical protein